MAKAIDMVATKPFTFEGRDYSTGECFSCRPIVAAALHHQRKARFAPAASRTLQRRDMVPESTHTEPEPTPTRPRRQYRRRDMVAEPE